MSAIAAKRSLVVVNPRSGTRRGLEVLERIRPVFAAAGIELAVRVTKYVGHAPSIARTAALADFDSLCVIGGDGTIHEVVSGLMERGEAVTIPLGLIPAGSGNALHQHLRCADVTEAARRIVAGKTCPLDVVRVTCGRQVIHCVDLIGWGVASDINRTANALRLLGQHRYAAAALWHILRARPRRARIKLDGRMIEDDFLFVAACNAAFAAQDMKLAPRAQIGDGRIDVVMVRRASRLEMIRLFSSVFDGSHLSMGCVEYEQVRSFAIDSAGPEPLNLDGEMAGHTPFHAEVLPGLLRVFQ